MNRRNTSDVHHHLAPMRKHHASLSKPSDSKTDLATHTEIEDDSSAPIPNDSGSSSLSSAKKTAHRFMLPLAEEEVG
jgi:hypothetical protein